MAQAVIGPKFQWIDGNGNPLAGGKLFTYETGTTTLKTTWVDETKTAPNTNPVILNGDGYADVYLEGSYNFVLRDSADVLVWSADPVTSNLSAASEIAPGLIQIATAAEATAGTNDTKAITPAKVLLAIPPATTLIPGKIELSTDAEAIVGTDTTRAVTPSGLIAAIADKVPTWTESAEGKAEKATTAEAEAGTDDVRGMTPLKTKEAIQIFEGQAVLKSTRSAIGTWTITGLVIGRPVLIIGELVLNNTNCECQYYVVSGTSHNDTGPLSRWGFGSTTVYVGGNCAILYPISTSVTIEVISAINMPTLRAYQGGN